MRAFAHIIVEQVNGHWSAWFSGRPQVSCGGQMPAVAIQRLLAGFGSNEYDGEQLVAIEDATRDGHLEFLIPHHSQGYRASTRARHHHRGTWQTADNR